MMSQLSKRASSGGSPASGSFNPPARATSSQAGQPAEDPLKMSQVSPPPLPRLSKPPGHGSQLTPSGPSLTSGMSLASASAWRTENEASPGTASADEPPRARKSYGSHGGDRGNRDVVRGSARQTASEALSEADVESEAGGSFEMPDVGAEATSQTTSPALLGLSLAEALRPILATMRREITAEVRAEMREQQYAMLEQNFRLNTELRKDVEELRAEIQTLRGELRAL
eukprot:gnl/TRDRNA2_/TRDRNA2_42181_c1_seq1.p1 gnl/TRDRNA2_/TRDRNA2_42181_c1~~gnl/TRDRNA2_/TRDRNA2_42181_c1_seq1.p1  ORF type:complete len:228 (-),score=44.75 gnl/TRDRNA2_/TRDRNA2_42181_c1_seq1:76-759(-)